MLIAYRAAIYHFKDRKCRVNLCVFYALKTFFVYSICILCNIKNFKKDIDISIFFIILIGSLVCGVGLSRLVLSYIDKLNTNCYQSIMTEDFPISINIGIRIKIGNN